MMRFFLVTLWITAWLPTIYSECSDSFDDATCTFNISCTGQFINQEHLYNSEHHTNCNSDVNGINIYNNRYHYYYYTINLQFQLTLTDIDNAPFLFGNNYDRSMPSSMNALILLDLSHQNSMELTEVPQFAALKNLVNLNLSRNMIEVAKFSNLNELLSLEVIDYSSNNIKRIVKNEGEFILKKLKKIDLSFNDIEDIPQTIFEDFKDLEYLDLSHNRIESLNALTFYGVRKLLQLYLSNNRIYDINSALLMLTNLQELSLDHNKIQIVRENDFKSLWNMRKVDLSFNYIKEIEKLVFLNTTSLGTILLNNNLLPNIDKDVFKIKSLMVVDLSNNNLHTLPRNLFKDNNISLFSVGGNTLQGSIQKGMFEGLVLVKILDLSHQNINSIENYAFDGISNVEILMLNNNIINFIAEKAFKNLQNLININLCNNKLTQINFITEDLINLRSLVLKWNNLSEIKNINLVGLQYLDLSNNNISHFDFNAFRFLRDLTTLKIQHNPLTGALDNNSFCGLSSLPSLDISSTLLNLVKNDTFKSITNLKKLNISHGNIVEVQFNAFSNTGIIEDIDISYNHIEHFSLNNTFLVKLRNLILNNNNIKHIALSTFAGLSYLSRIILSHNNIVTINMNAFVDQIEITDLDISYNTNLTFDISLLDKSKNLHNLYLSGIPLYNNEFSNIIDSTVSQLYLSDSAIIDLKKTNVKRFINLKDLCLSKNKLTKLEIGSFTNMTYLNRLDLSFNKIKTIQPGVFKDNMKLNLLNISHNSLLFLSYGIFRGLSLLNTLDISYNNISDLAREKFTELINMRTLIADNNKIEYIYAEELPSFLNILSIGANPLPCNLLINLGNTVQNLIITSIIKDESSANALLGVTCENSHGYRKLMNTTGKADSTVNEIKDILLSISDKLNVDEQHTKIEPRYLDNISMQINRFVEKDNQKLSDVGSTVVNEIKTISNNLESQNNSTNVLLEKMLRVLTSINSVRRAPVLPTSGNTSDTNIISYINKIKQDLEDTVAIEKHNMLNEVDKKITMINLQLDRKEAVSDQLIANGTEKTGFLFTEICVAFILVIMLLFAMYKLYKSRFIQSRRTSSTLQINEDSSQL